MRTYRSTSGPFNEKPFYSTETIEAMCVEELQKVGLYPTDPAPIRIDRFVEKRFSIQPTYEDLPKGLLGFTRFGEKGVEEIVVAKALDEEGTTIAERRLRTTLAHEAGHGLLHAHLFALAAPRESLFEEGLASDVPRILCREGGVSGTEGQKKPPYRWWEFQANQMMGELLLPKALAEKAMIDILVSEGLFGLRVLPADRRDRAVRRLSDVFDVNPIVARIRLDSLFPASTSTQLTL